MSGIAERLGIAFLAVLAAEAGVLLFRIAASPRRLDYLRMLLFLAFLALDRCLRVPFPGCAASFGVAVTAGHLLAPRHRLTRVLTAGGVAASTAVSVIAALGLSSSLPYALLCTFLLAALSLHPLAFLMLQRRRMRLWVFVLLGVSAVAWAAARAVELLWGRRPAAIPAAFVLVATGYLIFLDRYPAGGASAVGGHGSAGGWGGRRPARASSGASSYERSLETRLARAEGIVLLQDRLMATGLLAAGAAHEFRNTLASAWMAAQRGLRESSEDGKHAALETVVDRLGEAERTVAAFLERMASEGREEKREVDLRMELEGLVRFVRATYRREGVSVSHEVEGDVVVKVRFGELEHVLLNLLHNAAGSAQRLPVGAQRKVWIRTRRVGEELAVEVEDSGPGIPASSLGELFQPTVSSSGGVGLGLFIARSLAERNGGTLEYAPSGGRSVFRLSLPA